MGVGGGLTYREVMGKLTNMLAVAAVTAALLGGAAPAQAATGSTGSSSGSIEQLPASTQLPASPTSKYTYLIDANTGKILSKELTKPAVSTNRISVVGPGCSSTSVCLRSSSVPYYGYQYAGTLAVNVSNRTSYFTGSWTTRLKWVTSNGAAVTGAIVPPGTTALLTGSVTVREVRIY